MHVTLLGRRWRLRFCRLKDDDGRCDPPDRRAKTLRIGRGLGPERELEVTLHEALHACDWHKDEAWVEATARDLARLLWRLGYRKGLEIRDSMNLPI